MAFTFTVEDGTGLAGSNSYVSIAEADDYFAVDPNFLATWDALSDANKEIYLAWATRILDAKVSWRGVAYSATQALAWPRTGAYTRESYAIDSDEVPVPVKNATCELAKYIYTEDPTTGNDVGTLKKLVVDVIEIEYQDMTFQQSFPSIINDILLGLGVFRVGGRGYARILKA